MSRWVHAVLDWLTVFVLVALLVMASRRDGVIGSQFREWRVNRRVREQVDAQWRELSSGWRIDRGARPVEVVMFGDYECPSCRRVHHQIRLVLGDSMAIGFAYHHFPLPIHPRAEGAAKASICAARQGRFGAMHNRLYETSEWQSDTNWVREAREAGVADLGAFRACLREAATSERIEREKALARELSVTGTPTFFSRRRSWAGVLPTAEFVRALEDAR